MAINPPVCPGRNISNNRQLARRSDVQGSIEAKDLCCRSRAGVLRALRLITMGNGFAPGIQASICEFTTTV